MSGITFIASDLPFQKTEFIYKNIAKRTQTDADNFFSDAVLRFDENLSDAEKSALGTLFSGMRRYAVRGFIQFGFDPNTKIADGMYEYSKGLTLWLKDFIKKHLKNAERVCLVTLALGRKTDFKGIKTRETVIDSFDVSDLDHFEFDGGTVYRFVKNKEDKKNEYRGVPELQADIRKEVSNGTELQTDVFKSSYDKAELQTDVLKSSPGKTELQTDGRKDLSQCGERQINSQKAPCGGENSAVFFIADTRLSGFAGVSLDVALSTPEKDALGAMFSGRAVHAARSDIELGFYPEQKSLFGENYYFRAKKQICLLMDFIKETLKTSYEIFIVKLPLFEKINYSLTTGKYIDMDKFALPSDKFAFEPYAVYQFVDNGTEHRAWAEKEEKRNK
ncbi:MAG: hypothetical protein LBP62_04165 [Clostridiales bacterium]|jgi:hypothetical protein|nr:hypothetical protein [Clostridiales bacterium]